MAERPPTKTGSKKFQAPTGTRDMYPDDLLRARYIEKLWRDTSVRHGFDEIDGPTFEHLDLYTVKSGEGIVSELFSFRRSGGEKDYALRPEFTPTLARMYAARANALQRPCKWFWMQNCFRAERPQRGRLREFRQWNCDVLGDETNASDVEILRLMADLLAFGGLVPEQVSIRVGDRSATVSALVACGLSSEREVEGLQFLDRRAKMSVADVNSQATALQIDIDRFDSTILSAIDRAFNAGGVVGADGKTYWAYQLPSLSEHVWPESLRGIPLEHLARIDQSFTVTGTDAPWIVVDLSIARGLAYYTGMVFEVIAEGERAVAGGGRYDNLIELFGGPPTPAVGFGMGDVVLSLLLEDKGLMPTGRDLVEALSQPGASLRPDVFVVSNGEEGAETQVVPVVTALRSGVEADAWRERSDRKPWDKDRYEVRPLHARQTYKATRNVGKLMKEAVSQYARWAVVLESSEHCALKNLDTNEQFDNVPITEIGRRVQSSV